ncbi:MAG: hypothetical protein HZB95_06595 [Nitrosomonadales bacterium]|nr:hypothetical protein [Nitrosomonadales bacterium]
MTKPILFALLLLIASPAWPDAVFPGLQVEVTREGRQYSFAASFDTSLHQCAAYHYLTDYEAARELPGVVESLAFREAPDRVRVERTADEHVLFFHVRLRSVMEYTEQPFERISFTQLSGDSKIFSGDWEIEPNAGGSKLRFRGVWEPDTLIPLFIIDHFARNGLIERFSAIARLAEARKDRLAGDCAMPSLAKNGG